MYTFDLKNENKLTVGVGGCREKLGPGFWKWTAMYGGGL